VRCPAHRAGHLKNLDEGGLHPPYPVPHSSPVRRTGMNAGGFHKPSQIKNYGTETVHWSGVFTSVVAALVKVTVLPLNNLPVPLATTPPQSEPRS
jgi:hypothetical protein